MFAPYRNNPKPTKIKRTLAQFNHDITVTSFTYNYKVNRTQNIKIQLMTSLNHNTKCRPTNIQVNSVLKGNKEQDNPTFLNIWRNTNVKLRYNNVGNRC